MADVQSDNGWTRTSLGDGWVKVSEVCDAFENGGNDAVTTTAITNATVNAVSGESALPIINELKAAGSFMVEVVIGAGTAVADTHLLVKNSAGTYQVLSTDFIADQNQSTTAVASYDGAITDGLKIEVEKDSGTATNSLTVSLIYYLGASNVQDTITFGGNLGKDPS